MEVFVTIVAAVAAAAMPAVISDTAVARAADDVTGLSAGAAVVTPTVAKLELVVNVVVTAAAAALSVMISDIAVAGDVDDVTVASLELFFNVVAAMSVVTPTGLDNSPFSCASPMTVVNSVRRCCGKGANDALLVVNAITVFASSRRF